MLTENPIVHPKRRQKQCKIDCIDLKETLSLLALSQFWKRIVEAAKIHDDKRYVEIAESLESEEEFPSLQDHNRCRRIYTHSGTLERISN